MSITIEEVRTPAFSMKYFRFGSGSKTFVMLPGLSVQSVMNLADAVAAQYKEITDAFTVYVFDRREEIPEVYTVRDMARDTAEAIGALGLTDIYLFGASQGGMMGMVIAAEHPELVRGLVLGSTSACVREEQYAALQKWIRFAKEKDGEDLYLAFGEAIYPPNVFGMYKEILKTAGRTITEEEFARFVIMAEGTKDFNVLDDLPRISCPVLVLGDSTDAVLGAEASYEMCEKLKERQSGSDRKGDESAEVPVCECHMYDGFGHAAFDTAPDYRKRILGFFLGPHFQE